MTMQRTQGNTRGMCQIVLVVGIILRTVVFFVLGPRNNDDHFAVIEFIFQQHTLPSTGTFAHAHDPPLYHILGALMMTMGGIKTVQVLSLIFSIATLSLMYGLIRRLPWLDERLKGWCLALPAFHPQFVIYNLFVSTDTLAILVGTLIFDQGARCLERPTLTRQVTLALLLGVGLLTKFTFLAFCVPVALFFAVLNSRTSLPTRTKVLQIAALLLLAGALGSFKFVQNTLRYGQPFINTLDFDPIWAQEQRPVWIGIQTLLDVNILKLVYHPIISRYTAHSWPLTLYGSFWYSFMPECGFLTNLTRLRILGSLIYLIALVPTLLIVVSTVAGVRAMRAMTLLGVTRAPNESLFFVYALLILAATLLLVTLAAWKYDLWSMFQGRLLFPAYVSFVVLLHEGLRWVTRWRIVWFGVRGALVALYLCFFVYLAAEIRLSIQHPVDPGQRSFMPYRIDMKAPHQDG
jgi:4-amino-4-deoxy-L-arabinose transferase-like glycosyltransferase